MHRQEPEFEYIISRLLSHSITTAICIYLCMYLFLFFPAGSKVKCFDCNSYDDYRCADPFNWTTPPPMKQCEGCCVKIVQGIDTRKYKKKHFYFNFILKIDSMVDFLKTADDYTLLTANTVR